MDTADQLCQGNIQSVLARKKSNSCVTDTPDQLCQGNIRSVLTRKKSIGAQNQSIDGTETTYRRLERIVICQLWHTDCRQEHFLDTLDLRATQRTII
ncbi:hypothetical protein DPMN_175373 [Dreissena polymorpha]|uniref:Uncharacterized protein n=1 Tax=Dreissena polymorpha TaxID=45954 RepID=A0A9D4E987_DREPO|nr:hypothetical protein DPMN_175373 [Dreissena polymorpha]